MIKFGNYYVHLLHLIMHTWLNYVPINTTVVIIDVWIFKSSLIFCMQHAMDWSDTVSYVDVIHRTHEMTQLPLA